jgi:hypothetical protein
MRAGDVYLRPEQETWSVLTATPYIEAIDRATGVLTRIATLRHDNADVAGLLVLFNYADTSRQQTRRGLACHKCWSEHQALYVRGYCTLGNEIRTFRVDRMSEIYEIRSNRPIENPDVFFRNLSRPKLKRAPPQVRARLNWIFLLGLIAGAIATLIIFK